MSAPDGSAPPPAGEHIHLPGPSFEPILLAAGITIALIGVTFGLAILVGGLILTIAVIARWIRGARREMAELPEDLDEH